ncbi:unnamed protein product [Cyprideis torosa]|uniref:Uncharacterized protein n=1 Tax=Cyprideis torosa TaxID=163714 RepID=A0A7R8WIQ6_9CRUS|nr:unnamed protein product [Cyprideis torosa]CAG0898230.1 unnamed protein product [Cyprideis torosa]
MDAPAPFEPFLLFEGEKKVDVEPDGRVTNAMLFKISKEDSTLANLLKFQLLKDPNVLFAGYKLMHPFDYRFLLRVQTTDSSTPENALMGAITDLLSELSLLEERFKTALQAKLDVGYT